MTEPTDDRKFEKLVHKIDPECKLLRTWTLQGGVSAQVRALEIMCSNGQKKRMVVRQHGEMDIKQNPHVASNEFKLLQILKSAGLPTPKPYYLDESNEILPQPYVVIEFIEGKSGIGYVPSNLANMMSQLADCLSNIHSVECSKLDLSSLPKQRDVYEKMLTERTVNLDETLDERRIWDTLESGWTFLQRNKDVLLHGDFWTGNTLWRQEQLVAVIDWEDAALGDPLSDIANGRLEVLWAFGADAMNDFTRQYKSKMTAIDFTNLPYWDLCAAVRTIPKVSDWGLDESTENLMRDRHRLFVSQALQKLCLH